MTHCLVACPVVQSRSGLLLSKYSLFHEALLQKRLIILISLPVVLYSPAASTHNGTSRTSLKIYVSFAKEPYERAYILQKRPVI